MSYEHRGEGISLALSALWLFGMGMLVGSAINDSEEAVRDVQVYGQDIRDQLDGRYPRMEDLILTTDDDETFSFRTINPDGVPETCTGTYEVRDEVAVAGASIACSHTVKIG